MSSRYLIGIDLGTTNSVVAYLDTHNTADAALIRVFRVPQFLGAALMLGLLATLLRFVSGNL